jgi:hypothetical protein
MLNSYCFFLTSLISKLIIESLHLILESVKKGQNQTLCIQRHFCSELQKQLL